MASQITDEEFGTIIVRRNPKATSIRLRVAPDGKLRASMPMYAPLFLVKRLIKNSRDELRQILKDHHKDISFTNGMPIGKSHTLLVQPAKRLTVTRQKQHIIVHLPEEKSLDDEIVVREIRSVVQQALRLEAKSYLSKRLSFLAKKGGFSYEKVRFSHASGRWGSCSTNGTISLNIALMKLPFELIDYVLIHELSHTIEMNHSERFWRLVEQADPEYRVHRRDLKKETPSI
ncbi:MAG TPA: SprT family zinc-dependent metalloprotease [Candidatus Saccharimonadales bacterium]|nr:SprT family zinc-dependent metalloprotease [Candidatus Saccharimonadales bacterium]